MRVSESTSSPCCFQSFSGSSWLSLCPSQLCLKGLMSSGQLEGKKSHLQAVLMYQHHIQPSPSHDPEYGGQRLPVPCSSCLSSVAKLKEWDCYSSIVPFLVQGLGGLLRDTETTELAASPGFPSPALTPALLVVLSMLGALVYVQTCMPLPGSSVSGGEVPRASFASVRSAFTVPGWIRLTPSATAVTSSLLKLQESVQ